MTMQKTSETATAPVLDFSELSLDVDDADLKADSIQDITKQVMDMLSTTGYLYLKNTGLKVEEIKEFNKVMRDFFEQPEETKGKVNGEFGWNRKHGWIRQEIFNDVADWKEAFNVVIGEVIRLGLTWPNEEFRVAMEQMFGRLKVLALRFLTVLALGFGQKANFFTDMHKQLGSIGNSSLVRCVYYPQMRQSDLYNVKPGQLRHGDHCDFGSVTLLVSEDFRGLQLQNHDGNFVDIAKVEDPTYVLVIIGTILQRWTDDEIIAPRHHVVFNELTPHRTTEGTEDPIRVAKRQSFGLFVNPDNGAMVQSFKGKTKYKPIKALDYLNKECCKINKP